MAHIRRQLISTARRGSGLASALLSAVGRTFRLGRPDGRCGGESARGS